MGTTLRMARLNVAMIFLFGLALAGCGAKVDGT